MEKTKSQREPFKEVAREIGAEDGEERPNETLRGIAQSEKKVCPECGHIFKGNGWDGIDAHWRSKHQDVMPYEEAWPLLRDGNYV